MGPRLTEEVMVRVTPLVRVARAVALVAVGLGLLETVAAGVRGDLGAVGVVWLGIGLAAAAVPMVIARHDRQYGFWVAALAWWGLLLAAGAYGGLTDEALSGEVRWTVTALGAFLVGAVAVLGTARPVQAGLVLLTGTALGWWSAVMLGAFDGRPAHVLLLGLLNPVLWAGVLFVIAGLLPRRS
jgi:hypothetical protein